MSSSDESSGPELLTLNISDDQFYRQFKDVKLSNKGESDYDLDIPKYGSETIKHSLAAYDLWRPLFPTYLNEEKFRNFHRPKLRHYHAGPQSIIRMKKPKAFPIKNLSRLIYSFQKKLRYKVINAINQGMTRDAIIQKYLLIREAKDLTAKEGELFLFEYSEEFPPVLSQVGMALNIKTYKKPQETASFTKLKIAQQAKNLTSGLENSDPLKSLSSDQNNVETGPFRPTGNYSIGTEEIVKERETKFTKNQPKQLYYNPLKGGTNFRAIENNMYRAPIFQQDIADTDFLIIRTRNSFYIRAIKNIFTVGQTMPIVAIPEPTENAINKFRCNLSNLYLHKLFRGDNGENPAIDYRNFLRLFPDYSSCTLRRRLRGSGAICKTYRGKEFFLRGSSKYGLLSLKEERRMITPEQYCLNMAMLAARERLRDLNYTESMILPANDAELEPEVLAAPWATSKAVINALTGRSYLDFKKHLIDPTGLQREGFSCVTWTRSPTEDQQIKEQQSFSNPSYQSQNLSQIPTANPLANKIKREKLERLAVYQREAQIIAQVQAESLSSRDILSDIEGDDEEDEGVENLLDSSFDQQLQMLDKLVIDGQTLQEFNHNKEEEERHQMIKEFNLNGGKANNVAAEKIIDDKEENSQINVASFKNKILKITRTYETPEGEIQRTELVREPKIIALYIKQKEDNLHSSQEKEYERRKETDKLNVSWRSSQDISMEKRRSFSLGPSELCRAEGMVLTISKRVLDSRAMRKSRRNSRMREDSS